ncbi:MAG TPA: hypothetical protein VKM55_27290 [Candidatus Lokiarchaeia archaeon]|nr:hypothetical protein [Candidatus Lokiarchaeia archaeon]
MVIMKINKEWHDRNPMPPSPTFDQRVRWHIEHKKNCGCRPIPDKLMAEMNRKDIPVD